MSAISSDNQARACVADLSARIAEQTVRNQRASEFLDWVTAMLWIGFLVVPMTFALALHVWLALIEQGFFLNTVGLLLALVSPIAGVVATAGIIYVLGGPGSPQHLRTHDGASSRASGRPYGFDGGSRHSSGPLATSSRSATTTGASSSY